MNSAERFRRLDELFLAAVDLAAAERATLLSSLRDSEPGICAELERLLAREDARTELEPLAPTPVESLEAHELGRPDVGPYRLLETIGEGGMGTVWLGERRDGLIKRPVALKLPRGPWPRKGLLARLARERDILSALEHPNIARLYDAGLAADGQPYLALEYVEGDPIDRYVDDQGLDLRARLRLFLQVTDAVAHAHAKLIVHRDIKPSNILVTEEGHVRLLDFGIAKLLEDEHEGFPLTQIVGTALTPEYASPEHIAGEALTVATDVYSLGVLLYELLTGERPYRLRRQTASALEEAILETDPKRPSEIVGDSMDRSALRGDVDTIVLKALKKNPDERYATVYELAEDIQRHLDDMPVKARPDGRWYRARKFVTRNRLVVAASVAVVSALVVGALTALWQARIAFEERDRAEEVKEFIASIFREADPYVATGQLSAVDLLDQAHQRIDERFEDRPELRVELLNVVGRSLIRLQDTDRAETVISTALGQARSELGPTHPKTVEARVLMAKVHRFRGRPDEMREEVESVLPILRAAPELNRSDLSEVLQDRAHAAIDQGQYEEAVTFARESFDFALERFGEESTQAVDSGTLYGLTLHFVRDDDEAMRVARRALDLALRAYGDDPRHPRVADARGLYSRTLASVERIDEALLQLRTGRELAVERFGEDSLMAGFMAERLVMLAIYLGDLELAVARGTDTVKILSQHYSEESYNFATAVRARAYSRLYARRPLEALADLEQAWKIMSSTRGEGSEQALTVLSARALAMSHLGRSDDARRDLRVAMAGFDERFRTPPLVGWMHGLALLGIGEADEALFVLQLAFDQRHADQHPKRVEALLQVAMGQVLVVQGEFGDAVRRLESGAAALEKQQQQASPELADAWVALGRARVGLGQPQAAIEALGRANTFWQRFAPGSRWATETSRVLAAANR